MTKNIDVVVGASVKRLRQEKKLNAKTVGSWIGVSETDMRAIEQGAKPVTIHQLQELASKFNVRIADLLGSAVRPPAQQPLPGFAESEPGYASREELARLSGAFMAIQSHEMREALIGIAEFLAGIPQGRT